eukprot:tig00021589_g22706.t1
MAASARLGAAVLCALLALQTVAAVQLAPLENGAAAKLVELGGRVEHFEKAQLLATELTGTLGALPRLAKRSLLALLRTLPDVPPAIRPRVSALASECFSHEVYFSSLGLQPKRPSAGRFIKAVEATWGSFEDFKTNFTTEAHSVAGESASWVFLLLRNGTELLVVPTDHGSSPATDSLTYVIVAIDIGPDAFTGDRKNYIKRYLDVLDWVRVSGRFQSAIEDHEHIYDHEEL